MYLKNQCDQTNNHHGFSQSTLSKNKPTTNSKSFKKYTKIMQTRIVNKKIFLIFALSVFAIGSITPDSFAYADDEQNALDAITDIEFRTVTDFHTFVPDSQLRFDVSCNELAGEFAIGFNTFLQKADGTPADVNDVRNFVFLQRGSSDSGALIDAVNTSSDRLKLTVEVSCAKLLPESLPTVPYAPTEFEIIAGDKEATISWEEPLFDGNSIISKYEISAMPDPKTNSASDVFVDTEDLEFTFDGLVNGITYKFQVNAVNEIGSGIKSEILTGTPFGAITPTPVSYPVPTSNEKITVCHNNNETLSLPSQYVRAHLNNHGDILGACEDNTSTPTPTPTPTSTPTSQATVVNNNSFFNSDNIFQNFGYINNVDAFNTINADVVNNVENIGSDNVVTIGSIESVVYTTPQSTSEHEPTPEPTEFEADKAKKEADKLAKQEAKLLKQQADKAQKESDKLAKKQQSQNKV